MAPLEEVKPGLNRQQRMLANPLLLAFALLLASLLPAVEGKAIHCPRPFDREWSASRREWMLLGRAGVIAECSYLVRIDGTPDKDVNKTMVECIGAGGSGSTKHPQFASSFQDPVQLMHGVGGKNIYSQVGGKMEPHLPFVGAEPEAPDHEDYVGAWSLLRLRSKSRKKAAQTGAATASPDLGLLVFRGTSSKGDIMTDLRGLQEGIAELGEDKKAKAHRGFLGLARAQYRILKPRIKQWADEKLNVVAVGHSLGGALAQLNAAFAVKDFPSLKGLRVWTFGSPRVGNVPFQRFLEEHTNHVRVRNKGDPVPKVPFNHPGITMLNAEDKYTHACRIGVQLDWDKVNLAEAMPDMTGGPLKKAINSLRAAPFPISLLASPRAEKKPTGCFHCVDDGQKNSLVVIVGRHYMEQYMEAIAATVEKVKAGTCKPTV